MFSSTKKIDFIDEKHILLDVDKLQETKDEEKTINLYKLIQSVNTACEKNIHELKKLLSKHSILERVDALKLLNEDEDEKLFKSKEAKKKIKKAVISSLFMVCYEESQDNNNDLLFFAAATFNLEKLKEVIKQCDEADLNQVRFSDSVLVFTLKYGDISNEDFSECMKILIDAGVDVNMSDGCGHFAIDHVCILFNKNTEPKIREDLKNVARLLLNKKICETEEIATKSFIQNEVKFDLTNYKYATLDVKNRLFYWISRYKAQSFLSFKKIHHYVNCDNGESTLLQFAVNKSPNMLPIVQFLLKNGADPNKVTEMNKFSALELAARNNYESIFRLILNWKETKITENQFNNFVKWRGYCIKRELFGILLESDKLNPTFVYKKTGNTPLHYAIRLSHKNAIQKLLKRTDVSLTVRNIAGKCPLDILNSDDLKTFLDSCLTFDKRKTIDFSSSEYTMQFRFKRLTDGILPEVEVISQLGKYHHLENLLAHPLVHTYVMLKWYKVKSYFWVFLIFQAVFFLLLSVFFYRFPYSTETEHAVCLSFCILNIVLKCWIFLIPKDLLKEILTLDIKPTTFHEYCEILLMITSIASLALKEVRAFVFVEMAIIFLLTAGYHPKLSHWSMMLQNVFKTFTKLLIFFSLLMFAFAVSFHIMFEDHRFFAALYRSVFMSYFMTIGEINVSEVDFETTPIGGYLLFFLFAMSMSVVIINIWTGVAIRDIDKFEKRSEVNALKNVIAFLAFIEKHVYRIECLKKILINPLLFPEDEVTFVVDFFINKDNQFESRSYKEEDDKSLNQSLNQPSRDFPQKLNHTCIEKIKAHYYKQQNNTNEQKILMKLDKILKILDVTGKNRNDILNRIYKRVNTVV